MAAPIVCGGPQQRVARRCRPHYDNAKRAKLNRGKPKNVGRQHQYANVSSILASSARDSCETHVDQELNAGKNMNMCLANRFRRNGMDFARVQALQREQLCKCHLRDCYSRMNIADVTEFINLFWKVPKSTQDQYVHGLVSRRQLTVWGMGLGGCGRRANNFFPIDLGPQVHGVRGDLEKGASRLPGETHGEKVHRHNHGDVSPQTSRRTSGRGYALFCERCAYRETDATT
jgi:hypothetical protein